MQGKRGSVTAYKAPKKYGQYNPSSCFEATTLPARPVSDVLRWGEIFYGRRLLFSFKTCLMASSRFPGDPDGLAAGGNTATHILKTEML